MFGTAIIVFREVLEGRSDLGIVMPRAAEHPAAAAGFSCGIAGGVAGAGPRCVLRQASPRRGRASGRSC